MLVATWNLNNRVGRVPFRPNAADAATSLEADVLVFTEFYPQEHEAEFASTLRDAGWSHQEISRNGGEKANRIFISSRLPLQSLERRLPAFDQQFPSNVLCVGLPTVGLSIVGIRIPWYEKEEIALVTNAWDWLESTAAALLHQPSIILGDLNVVLTSARSRGGEHFRRILQSGWHRATPKEGASYFGEGGKDSEIDHISMKRQTHGSLAERSARARERAGPAASRSFARECVSLDHRSAARGHYSIGIGHRQACACFGSRQEDC